mgnify:CR=1 FL=1
MRILKTKVGLTFTIMILSSIIIGLSYAAFVYTSSSYKASELMLGNLMYGIDITSTGGSETISGTSVTLSNGSTSTVLVKITSLNPINSNYGLDYQITSGSGNIYYTKSTESLPTGSINGYNDETYSKTITVLIEATSNMTVQFNVTGGYTYTTDLTPASGYTRLSQVYVPKPALAGQYSETLGNLQSQFTKDSQNQIKFNSKKITFTNNCTNASARFNYAKGVYEIRNIGENANCDLGFTSSNTVQYLNNYVISLNNQTVGDGKVVNENGYRYEGINPNNYLLYNGELWRIIGVFGSEMHGQTGNLVKIIRNDSIGGLVYSTSSVNSWGESTLYNLLNQTSGGSYYTGVDYTNKASGTYCSSYYGYTPIDCSFSKTGIRSDYARGMIQEAKWYSPVYETISNAPTTYTYDITTTTSNTGYIGLMYASDYVYAVQASDCARTISFGTTNVRTDVLLTCAGKNWLRLGKIKLTISRYNSSHAWTVYRDGNVLTNNVFLGGAVHPVLYLKSSVYYVSGSGSYDDPIVIGN